MTEDTMRLISFPPNLFQVIANDLERRADRGQLEIDADSRIASKADLRRIYQAEGFTEVGAVTPTLRGAFATWLRASKALLVTALGKDRLLRR